MDCFVQLVKVDEERRLIHGRAVQEVPDRSREILDYESAKPAFLEWSKACEDATAGLSKGNVRVMHGKSVAGKVVDIAFNDDEKAIDIVVKVVDDNEWRKCLEGCYTGFSVGGSYAKKWQDGEFTRYTPRVTEVSLVDRPCIPTAKFFSIHKADGSVEEREFVLDDASRMTDAERLAAIAALAGGMMPNSLDAAMPVPEQMTDTRETAQPKSVATGAVEKVAPSLFGDLYKADERKGRDGDGDGKLNEGRAGAAGAGIGYAMSKTAPVLFADLYKADGRAGRDADGDGKYNEKEGGSGTRTVGAAVGGALAGAALTAAALRTGKGQAAVAAARSASGPLTAAAQRAVKDIGGAAKVIGNSAAGKYAGEQYAAFRNMPKLVQLAAGGTALAVTPGGDKLLGLVGLDPNAEWVPGGFRFDLKSKSTGTTVFSQSVRPFADGGSSSAPYTPPQQQYQQPQQAQRPAAQSYQSTGSIMGQPARPPAQATTITSQPPARDAATAYASAAQINSNNPNYTSIKQKLEFSASKGLFEGDRHESLPHDLIVSASRAAKENKINPAERNDIVFRTMKNERTASGAKRFDLSTSESAYTALTEHLADQHDAEIYKENEDYRRADRARINALPGLSPAHRKELHSYLDNAVKTPLPFNHKELNKAVMFDELYKSWMGPGQSAPLLFADLYKADGRAGRDGDGDGKLHEDGDTKGGGGSFHDGRGYLVAAKNRAHEKALKAGTPDTKEYADSYHKAMIQEDPKYKSEHTQVIDERRGRDVWPIMAAKATSWAAFGAGAALGAAMPSKVVGRVGAGVLGGLAGATKGAVGGFANSTRKVRFGSKSFEMGGKDWASRLGMSAAGAVKEEVGGAYLGAKAAGSKPWVNRAANAAVASNLIGWGTYFAVQPPVRFLGEVNDAVRSGARRVEKADV
ncbi:hypothetical protein ABMY26_06690 (plasmid) [Azospirillum sp. HJ39]|uniref:hypothetical protein n=1 Tax=Azospirillum sp. HJ39 TaxID=3159496 RepID=UPI003555C8B3